MGTHYSSCSFIHTKKPKMDEETQAQIARQASIDRDTKSLKELEAKREKAKKAAMSAANEEAKLLKDIASAGKKEVDQNAISAIDAKVEDAAEKARKSSVAE